MGLLDLSRAFDGTDRILKDQATTFTDTGNAQTVTGTISDFHQALPGDPGLDRRAGLHHRQRSGQQPGPDRVTAGGSTYKGNVFSGQYSTTGGTADAKNNVESVFHGSRHVRVLHGDRHLATNIAGDGVTNNSDTTDQDFALVVYNGTETNVASISATGSTLTSESGTANSLPGPWRDRDLSVHLQERGHGGGERPEDQPCGFRGRDRRFQYAGPGQAGCRQQHHRLLLLHRGFLGLPAARPSP